MTTAVTDVKLVLLIVLCSSTLQSALGSQCRTPGSIWNGVLKVYDNNTKLKITCNEGFYERYTDIRCRKGRRGRRWVWQAKNDDHQWRFCRINSACATKRCPKPRIENGNIHYQGGVDGDDSHGSVVTAECYHGYMLYGSPNRTCQVNSRWSGVIQTCQPVGTSGGQSVCEDPGIPDGAIVEKDGLKVNDRIRYSCSQGLVAFGDSVRQCLSDGGWSGSPFVCYDKNSYDLVEEATLALAQNLDDLKVDTCNQDNKTCQDNYRENCEDHGNCWMYNKVSHGRKKRFLDEASKETGLDLYIALDTSDSVAQSSFEFGKEFIKAVINKLGMAKHDEREENGTRYEIHTFNNDVDTIIGIDDQTVNTQEDLLKRFEARVGNLTTTGGTSIPKVLDKIRVAIATQKASDDKIRVRDRKKIVMLLSDGYSNMDGDPTEKAKEIKKYEAKILGIHLKANDNDKNSDLDFMEKLVSDNEGTKKFLHVLRDIKSRDEVIKNLLNTTTDYSPCGYQGLETGFGTISSGEESIIGQWPWMVQLTRNHKSHCGATILDSHTLLTAAHCFYERLHGKAEIDVDQFMAIAGRLHEDSQELGIQTSRLEANIIHEDYDRFDVTSGNDIAIVKLKKKFKLTHQIRPICISGVNNAARIEPARLENTQATMTIAGWGATTTTGLAILRHGSVRLSNDCHGDAFCAGNTGNVTCPGDSGGPLMRIITDPVTNEQRYYEIGIVSYGNSEECEKVTKSYFTRISSYVDWITEQKKSIMGNK